jgi:hypothetical protein
MFYIFKMYDSSFIVLYAVAISLMMVIAAVCACGK